MALCHILPLEWHSRELHLLWNRWRDRGALIDLDLVRSHFRTPVAHIDATQDPPVISESQAYPYAQEPQA